MINKSFYVSSAWNFYILAKQQCPSCLIEFIKCEKGEFSGIQKRTPRRELSGRSSSKRGPRSQSSCCRALGNLPLNTPV